MLYRNAGSGLGTNYQSYFLKTGYKVNDLPIKVQTLSSMEVLNSSVKKRIARYLDAILFISAILLISSLLEVIRL